MAERCIDAISDVAVRRSPDPQSLYLSNESACQKQVFFELVNGHNQHQSTIIFAVMNGQRSAAAGRRATSTGIRVAPHDGQSIAASSATRRLPVTFGNYRCTISMEQSEGATARLHKRSSDLATSHAAGRQDDGEARRSSEPAGQRMGSPKLLTLEVINCTSVSSLHSCLSRIQVEAGGITIAAAITHLAKLADRRGGRISESPPDSGLEMTLSLAISLLRPHFSHLPIRGFANCIWALSKLATARTVITGHGDDDDSERRGSGSEAGPSSSVVHQDPSSKRHKGRRRKRRQDQSAADGESVRSPAGSDRGAVIAPRGLTALAVSSAEEIADAMLMHGKASMANAHGGMVGRRGVK